MGSKSNSWCKKLMAKDKAFKMRQALGDQNRHMQATSRDPVVRPPKNEIKHELPRAATWRPRGFGRRGSGSRLGEAARAMVELRAAKRAAFFASLASLRQE